MANKYENIKHNDSCSTVFGQSSTFSVTVIKTQSISVDKADFEKTFQFWQCMKIGELLQWGCFFSYWFKNPCSLREMLSTGGEPLPFIRVSENALFCSRFVRFREVESVFKAVKTLHRWPLKGVKIVVDVAKDTGDKIKKGEIL